jgi:hypothetical protein
MPTWARRKGGGGWADTRINIRLPVSLREGAGTTPSFGGGGWGQRPKVIMALNEAGERHWLLKLVGEMNRELRLCLATAVSVGRTLSAVRRQERSVQKGRVATLGVSNAANTAAALGEAGVEVVTFGKVGWRVTAEKVEAMVEEISLECKDTNVLLLHCLDNQVFYVMDEETWGMAFPAKGTDVRYHAKGKVTVAEDLPLENLLEKMEPLLRWGPDNLKLLVTLVCRHVIPCCEEHGRDRQEQERETARLLKSLGEMRRAIRSWLMVRGIKNVFMVNPLAVSGAAANVEKAIDLMNDSVHMKKEDYNRLAKQCKDTITTWLLGKKRKAVESYGAQAKKQRLDGQSHSQAVPASSKRGGGKTAEPEKGPPGKTATLGG